MHSPRARLRDGCPVPLLYITHIYMRIFLGIIWELFRRAPRMRSPRARLRDGGRGPFFVFDFVV